MNIVKDTSVKKFGLASLTLIFAVLMFLLVTPFALVFNIIQSIYHKTINGFIRYWGWIIYQVWTVIYILKFSLALCIDFFGNAFAGNLLKHFILKNKQLLNLFGIGTITISAAIGQAIFYNNCTKFGLKLSSWLDVIFNEKDHCLTAFNKYLKETK